jgi:hypothetical protein
MSPVGFTKKHKTSPKQMMIIGVSLMVLFVLMEFLFVMGVLPNVSFAPHMIGYALSTGGMMLALIGYVSDYKGKHNKDQ